MRQPRNDDAIRLHPTNERGARAVGIDWRLIRAIFMRVLGLFWLAKGLYWGALIIGLFGRSFQSLGPPEQAAAAFSAIGDCIAGVGLWLTVSWGAVTWIAVALAEMAFAFSSGAGVGPALAVLAPIFCYALLSLLSARQTEERL